MDLRRLCLSLLGPVALGSLLATAFAESPFRRLAGDDWCDPDEGDLERPRHCEVREALVPAGSIRVDARPNGGIQVQGASRSDVRILAKVVGVADSEAAALAEQVHVLTDGTVRAEGPPQTRRRHWSVSFKLSVPKQSDLDLTSMNGGIAIKDVSGTIAFETMNGGVSIEGLAGDVRGRTTNGGVNVRLAGRAWEGEGLDVSTTNGGVNLTLPEDFNAHVETGTVNGHLNVDFPVKVHGRLDRRLTLDLGSGGPPIRVMTTNGGVRLRRP